VSFHEPTTPATLQAILAQHPDAVLVAGGTQLMRSPARHLGDRPLVSLRRVEPLGRVSRTQRFLDIGAAVSLARVLSIGPRVVPRSLFAALKATASPTVRVLATLGGNICALGVEHTSLAALAALDAQLELRRGAASRLLPAALFWRGGSDRAIQPGEVLMRVRLPLDELEAELFTEETVSWRSQSARVAFSAAVAAYKGTVESLRLCVASPWFGTLRFGDFEGACVGVRLPMRERSLEDLVSMLKRSLVQRLGAPIPEVAPILAPAVRLARGFLRELGKSSGEDGDGRSRYFRG